MKAQYEYPKFVKLRPTCPWGRYIPEAEMQSRIYAAAGEQGLEDAQAKMLAGCGRNLYAIGCGYQPSHDEAAAGAVPPDALPYT